MKRTRGRIAQPLLMTVLCAVLTVGCAGLEDPTQHSSSEQMSLHFPTRDHVLSSVEATRDFVGQFAVSAPLAEHWARYYAKVKGPYQQTLHTCLAVPSEDVNGTLTAWYFVLSTEATCTNYNALIDLAREEWRRLGVTIGNVAELDQRLLQAVLERSADRFFTVQVAAYSYRHPLREAHRGLPAWALTTALETPKALADGCVATSALPARPTEGDYEVMGYQCGDSSTMRLFSHSRRLLLSPLDLDLRYAPEDAFEQMRHTMVNKYVDAQLDQRLDEMRKHWMIYLAEILGGSQG